MDSVLVIRLVLIIADELEDGVFKGPRTAHEALVEVPLEWSKEATPTEGWGFASALTNKPYQTTRCRSVIASLPDGVCLSAGVWRWFGRVVSAGCPIPNGARLPIHKSVEFQQGSA